MLSVKIKYKAWGGDAVQALSTNEFGPECLSLSRLQPLQVIIVSELSDGCQPRLHCCCAH